MSDNSDEPSASTNVDGGESSNGAAHHHSRATHLFMDVNEDADSYPPPPLEFSSQPIPLPIATPAPTRIPSRPQPSRRIGESYAPATLAKHNIKVRDFAYESKLPPLPSVRFPVRQRTPGPRPLKRDRRDWDDEGPVWQRIPSGIPNYLGAAGTSQKRPKQLERTPTEPVIDNGGPSQRRREYAYTDLSDYASSQEPETKSQNQDTENISVQQPASASILPFAPTPLRMEADSAASSLDDEPYIVTPIVTPNGSLQFRDNNSIIPRSSSSRGEEDTNGGFTSHPIPPFAADNLAGRLNLVSTRNGTRSSSSRRLPPTNSGLPFVTNSSPTKRSTRGRARKATDPSKAKANPDAGETDAQTQRYYLRKRAESPAAPPPKASTSRTSRSRSRRRAATPPVRKTASKQAAVPATTRTTRSKSRTRHSDENRAGR